MSIKIIGCILKFFTLNNIYRNICVTALVFNVFFQLHAQAQTFSSTPENSLIPEFHQVYDAIGNSYSFNEIKIDTSLHLINSLPSRSMLLCNSGYFDLYFETGSGMDNINDPLHIQRRNVICRVFEDISDFLPSSLTSNNETVKIWIRNPSNVAGAGALLAFASSYYSFPAIQTPTIKFIEGEIRKTIQSGENSYQNLVYPITNFGLGNQSGNYYYHGVLGVNFSNLPLGASLNYNLTNFSNLNTSFDFYSIILHEVMHMLGIQTFFNANANSIFSSISNVHTVYDIHVSDSISGGNSPFQLIDSLCPFASQIYNSGFDTLQFQPGCINGNPAQSDSTFCPNALWYNGSVNIPLFTPTCFQPSSSLAHFEDMCYPSVNYANNNDYFVMSNAASYGFNGIKRYPKNEERSVLCDLGYSMTNHFGSIALGDSTYHNYPILNCGYTVAGINDALDALGSWAYIGQTGGDTIFFTDILNNDINAVSISCFEVYNTPAVSSITLFPPSSTGFTLITGNTSGPLVFSYIPVDAQGNQGNITYVIGYIYSGNCVPDNCNLLFNAGFELGSGCGFLPTLTDTMANCWQALSGTPDLFERNCLDSIPGGFGYFHYNVGNNTLCNTPPVDSHDSISNNRFVGLNGIYTSPPESIEGTLSNLLIPGISYQLSFYGYLNNCNFDSSSTRTSKICFYALPGFLGYGAYYNVNSPGNTLFSGPHALPDDAQWHLIVDTFTYNGVLSSQIAIANDILPTDTGKYGYVFVDDIQLVPLSQTPVFTLPVDTVCINYPDIILDSLVIPSGGSFTGNGVNINSTGQYVFSAALAGSGQQNIIYQFADSLGCTLYKSASLFVDSCIGNYLICPSAPQGTYSIPNGSTISDIMAFYPSIWTNVNNTIKFSGNGNILNFELQGKLIIDTVVEFDSCNFIALEGAQIISNNKLTLNFCEFSACNNMWKGIQSDGTIISRYTYFKDAEWAINFDTQANYKIQYCHFVNNLIGMRFVACNPVGYITGNIFRNTGILVPPYSGMTGWQAKSICGVQAIGIDFIQIGLMDTVSTNDSVYPYNPNYFRDLNCGIYGVSSTISIYNSFFRNIKRPNLSPPLVWYYGNMDGAAVFSSGSGSMPNNLYMAHSPGVNSIDIDSCTYGIRTRRTSLPALTGLKIRNTNFGIYADQSSLCTFKINTNDIEAKQYGIRILNAEYASWISIRDNDIYMNNYSGNAGISVSASIVGNADNTQVLNNYIKSPGRYDAGIHISALNTPSIRNNHVERLAGFYPPWLPPVLYEGLYLAANSDADVSCNQLYKNSANTALFNNGIDINNLLNTGSFIKCNTTGASRIGMQVSGPNFNSTLRTNNFGSHYVGLYYDTSAVTGPQPANINDLTEGNRWLGSYGNYGAKNSAQQTTVNQSIYYVNGSQAAEFNPSFYPSGWFDNQGNVNHQPLCASDCSQRVAIENNISFYEAIASGNLLTNGYPVQTLWMSRKALFGQLDINDSLLNSSDTLNNFYFSPLGYQFKSLKNIEDTLKAGETDRKLLTLAKAANDSLQFNLTHEINNRYIQMLAYSLTADSAILPISNFIIINYLQQELSDDLNEQLNDNLFMAAQLNEEIEPENANEALEKTVNEIYFTYFAFGFDTISSTDSSLLAGIAQLCPLAGGSAIIRARDMYALLNDTIMYNDSALCRSEGFYRESINQILPSLEKKESKQLQLKIYPVPAQNKLTLLFPSDELWRGIKIFDSKGRMVQFINTVTANGVAQIDVSGLANGIYLAQIFSEKEQIKASFSICK